jgi:hypothetical protein
LDTDPKIMMTSFTYWAKKFEASYDLFLSELEAKVRVMQEHQVPDDVIIKILKGEISNEEDVFASLLGKSEKYIDDMSNAVAQSASNDFDMNEKLSWVMDPGAEHCNDCLANSQRDPMTFAEWQMVGFPGAGNTECKVYCKCTLEPEIGGSGAEGGIKNVPGWAAGKADRDLADKFVDARNQMPKDKQEFLSHTSAEDLVKNNAKIYLSEDEQNGFIISKYGDLQNVFSRNHKGKESIKLALENGAETLDCFDGFLPKYYEQFGFKEYKREKNWVPGEPDVVYMRLEKK